MNHPQANQPHDDRHSEGIRAHGETLPLIVLPTSPEAIPGELRALTRWVCWRFEPEEPTAKNPNPRPRKVPVIAGTSSRASSTDPRQWRSFELAWRAASASNGTLGIGFVFAPDDGYCGVDLDDCINEAGELSPEAKELIERFATYSEISPSGTGVKLIFRGKKPAFAGASVSDVLGCRKVEVFERARYFTITGQVFEGSCGVIAECQRQLDELCAVLWPKKPLSPAPLQREQSNCAILDASVIPMERRERWCRKYIEKCPDAINGHSGHNKTLRAACECLRFGLDDPATWRVMRWFNDQKTGDEPWTDKELEHKISSARAKVDAAGEFGQRLQTVRSSNPKTQGGENMSATVGAPAVEAHIYNMPPSKMAELTTDVGNAARLVAQFGSSLRFCHPTGQWFYWDGTRWRADNCGLIVQRCKSVALNIIDEARNSDDERRDRLLRWATASQKKERITAMAALAQSDLAITPEELDADPWLLNCLNGTIDLKTGELRPHSPQEFITKLVPVHFDPDAKCPLFESFLHRIFDGDSELITFVVRWHGHCLTGDVREQYMPIYHGEGNNGKSVLLDTITGIMGDYACEAPPHLIVSRTHEEHPTEIADLMGRRFIVASETERDAELKLQLVKRLTGNARLKGRYMRQDYFEFERTHKMVIVTNNMPVVREDSEAVWRRLRLVPFRVVIPKHERDPKLLEKFRQEWPGILALLVRNCVDWQREGLNEPIAVMHATDKFRGTATSLDRFIEECCDLGAGLSCFSSDLVHTYEEWCQRNNCKPLKTTALGDRLRERGCESERLTGGRGWLNIAIRSSESG